MRGVRKKVGSRQQLETIVTMSSTINTLEWSLPLPRLDYSHSQLKVDDQSIRLLSICPPQEYDPGAIQIELEAHALDADIPSYLALSYTWGDVLCPENPPKKGAASRLEQEESQTKEAKIKNEGEKTTYDCCQRQQLPPCRAESV